MAGNIKGITISFQGDTSSLDKALRKINDETKGIDRELKAVNKALKFNPGNVDLWRQKQELLKNKISETKDKLDVLKQAQQKMDAAGVDKNSEEYRKLQRDIIATESQVKTFEAQLRKIGNVNLRAASEQLKDMGNNLKSAGQSMTAISTAAAAVTASIGALTVKSGQWADDINTMSKKYSIATDDLQMYAAAAELVDVDVETIAKSHVKLEKSMSSASKGTGATAEAFETLGVSVTNADGSLRDGDEVWQETIAALGQVENETERDALAMQLMGKSAAELNPLIENGGEAYQKLAETMAEYGLDFIDEETLQNANAFNDSLDTIKAVGLIAFQQLGTQLAATFAPIMEKVVGLVGQLANWLANLDPKVVAVIATVAGVLAVLAPLLIIIGQISTGIGALMGLFAVLAGPVGIVIAAIAALVAIGVVLYKNWDLIKAKAIAFKDAVVLAFNDFKTKVSNIFNAIKTAITTPIQNAIDTVKGIIERIKGFFPIKLGNIFNFKLPHIKIGSKTVKVGDKDVSVPTFNVEWYAKGGLFNSPQIIGVGENGPEAVVPLDKFWDKLDRLAEGTNAAPIVINVYGSDNMSVNELAAAVEQRLIQMQKRRTLAWQ